MNSPRVSVDSRWLSCVMHAVPLFFFFFFFNDTATTEIYTLSLHDALPISCPLPFALGPDPALKPVVATTGFKRSEEHTSELQSRQYLVCRLLLEKKKKSSETSCSPLRPPNRIPTRSFFIDIPCGRDPALPS